MTQSIQETILKSRVFILGAGFSASAGIPMIGQLLTEGMKLFKCECPGIYERVTGYAATCFCLDDDQETDYTQLKFADLCTFLEYIELREYGGGERWTVHGSREKLAFRYYLSKAIANSTPSISRIPELYIQFAKQLKKMDVIITFNWDPLLEVALEKIGKSYCYNNAEEAEIQIYKLHGSINWRLGYPKSSKFSWKPLSFPKALMKEDVFYCKELINSSFWKGTEPLLGEVEPFLVLPGSGKAYDVRAIAPLWYKPEFAFAFTHDVYIIGLSLTSDDFFIKSFFIDNLPYIKSHSGIPERKIIIINPDKRIVDNYSFISNKDNVNFIFEKFSLEHIKFMQNRLETLKT